MSKINLNGAMHTAGIYSDMTVDGPEIGTLVVVVDRAKNLPNRKTIGKQDPYCACRLGKEAKKTDTDRRGGQTPRWDQEMRFTVHDSPDYYQLKVSVFNDDKKTEIIGETWVSLVDVVVPGGGKNDLWHNLNFKGKYAGEIRIEITYYDTRPKPEKPQEKKRQAAGNDAADPSRDPMAGPRQMKAVKRRPLPNNPTTGSPSLPRPALAAAEQNQVPARGRPLPSSERPFDHPPSHIHGGARGPPASDYAQSARGRGMSVIPDPISDHMQTPPPRGRQLPQEYQPNQSPLQHAEYNTPSPRFAQSHSNRHSPYDANGYQSSPAPAPLPVNERYDICDPAPQGSEYIPGAVLGRYDDLRNDGDVSPQMTYHAQPEPSHYALPAPEEYNPPLSPGGPPPPPPLHGAIRPSPLPHPMSTNDAWDMPNFATNSNAMVPHDPHVTHSQSMPVYTHAKSYQAYSPPREQYRPQSRDHRPPSRDQRPQSRDQQNGPRHISYDDPQRPQSRNQYETGPRHQSFDERYRNGFESMQPTVEDAPPSPGPGALTHPSSGSFSRSYDDRRFDQVQPLNLNGSGRGSVSTQSSFQASHGYSSVGSFASSMDRTQNSSLSSKHSATKMNLYQPPRRRDSEDQIGAMPHVPSSLVAGMDPMIAQEISERIYSDQRGNFSNAGTFPRNGYHPENAQSPYQQARPTSSYGQQARPTSSYGRQDNVFVPASTPNSYSQSIVPMNGTIRERSPAPMGSQRDPRVPMRKSVSPAPGAREHSRSPAPPRERRLSGVPFGPDDYDALNPNVGLTASKSGIQFSDAVDSKNKSNGITKIISHDGRVIDPSDYLPVDTYAAEYEKKVTPKPTPPPLQTAASLALARPRSQGRPYSMVPASNSSVYMIKPTTNPSPGRTRLQKKSARTSAPQAPMSNAIGPLAPLNHYQDNSNNYTPRSMARTSTGDFGSNENYAPSSNALTNYGNPGYRGGSAPPIPAKVPMNNGAMHGQMSSQPRGMGRALPPQQQQQQQQQQPINHGEAAWSLLEEMKSIDLGNGNSRSRRKGW